MSTPLSPPAPVLATEASATTGSRPAARPSRLAIELGVITALWRRDMLRLARERSRWMGVVLQPLLFWAILGAGMTGVFALPGAADVDFLAFSFPGILVMVVLFTTVFATMAVIDDRQQGFLQQVLAGPGSRASLVAGKTLGVTTVALLQAVLCLAAAPLAGYDLLAISWPMLLAVLILGSVMLVGLSFSLAWVVGSSHGYHALMAVLLLPLWLASGALFPAQGTWIDRVTAIDPMTYMVDGVRHAMGSGAGAWSGPTTSMITLAALAVAAFGLAVFTTRVGGGRP